MLNLFRSKTRRIHTAQLAILVGLGDILIHLAIGLYRHLHAGIGNWVWGNLSLTQKLFSGFDYLLSGGGLVLVGIVLVYIADAYLQREHIEPMQELLTCVQAAAAGDLSRVPAHGISGEVGELSRAIGRLITVLGRSENLVYHLSTLVESSSDAIISFTLEGTISSWNKGAQRIYGYSLEEAKGKSIAMVSPIDQGAEIMRNLESIRQDKRVQPFEAIHQARNGRIVKAFVRVSPILDSTRTIIGASFCAQDLTETRLLQSKQIKDSQIS